METNSLTHWKAKSDCHLTSKDVMINEVEQRMITEGAILPPAGNQAVCFCPCVWQYLHSNECLKQKIQNANWQTSGMLNISLKGELNKPNDNINKTNLLK